nr:hypothetical protein Iba_chr05cCG14600 [Ipomoea batatas]GME20331.1 hypothetical protein Iba_scaffold24856CG0010 [Ipomoea batatas]
MVYHSPNSKGVASHQGPWLKRGSRDATEGSKVECCQLARNGYISLDQFHLSFIYHRLTLQLQLCSLARLSFSIVLLSSQISVCHLPLPPASIGKQKLQTTTINLSLSGIRQPEPNKTIERDFRSKIAPTSILETGKLDASNTY